MNESLSLELGRVFLSQAAGHLSEDFMPKIKACLRTLDEGDVWWRGSEVENSVGNLLLHLAGNVRQWIISGLGGEEDLRRRAEEFAARGGIEGRAACERLEAAVAEAVAVLRGLKPEALMEEKTIQGYKLTALQAVFHVVEHFSYHTGQIVYIAKLRAGQDMKFYNL